MQSQLCQPSRLSRFLLPDQRYLRAFSLFSNETESATGVRCHLRCRRRHHRAEHDLFSQSTGKLLDGGSLFPEKLWGLHRDWTGQLGQVSAYLLQLTTRLWEG